MIVTILTAFIVGFVAGALGSLVTREMTEHTLQQKTIQDAQQYAVLNRRVEKTSEQFNLCAVALEQLTYKFKRERGAIWESLNGLWADYDQRHNEQEPEQKKEEQKPEQETATLTVSDIREPHDVVIEAEKETAPERTKTAEKRTKKKKTANTSEPAKHPEKPQKGTEQNDSTEHESV